MSSLVVEIESVAAFLEGSLAIESKYNVQTLSQQFYFCEWSQQKYLYKSANVNVQESSLPHYF